MTPEYDPLRPSTAQRDALERLPPDRGVVFYYRWRAKPAAGDGVAERLRALSRRHGGHWGWSGREQQLVIPAGLSLYSQGCRIHFPGREAAARCVDDPAHAGIFHATQEMELQVMTEQPTRSRWLIRVLAALLPWWRGGLQQDAAPEPPGRDPSILPDAMSAAELHAHAQPQAPVVMINWLRFRRRADYAEPRADGDVSGAVAYYRYGQVALGAIHQLGGKILFMARYRLTLIGNGGDPALGRWHDFLMAQYPGRASFLRMTSLLRYRAALAHREAGLESHGQGLIAADPAPENVWRGWRPPA